MPPSFYIACHKPLIHEYILNMKKVLYYTATILIIVILMPMLIVKGCGFGHPDSGSGSQPEGVRIKVFVSSEKKTVEMQLEEYIKGVVAAEMPASFESEALKAQAIAARTYAFSRVKKVFTAAPGVHDSADICTDPAHCQAWMSKSKAMKGWGVFAAIRNWNKIERAVSDTKGIIITYNGEMANPLFHSNSGGRTENSEDVWDGVAVPYLRSVESAGEEGTSEYTNVVRIKTSDFSSKLKEAYPDLKLSGKDILQNIKVQGYTQGGRVKTIKIGNITLKGTDFRKVFSLKSANFKIESSDKDTLKITTLGYGHGVGMSQWGANYLAKSGANYEEILKYYYTGIDLITIDEYNASKKKVN